MNDLPPSPSTPEPESASSLPLDELTLTPQWVKSAAPSYQNFTERDRGPRKHDRFDRRDRGPRPDRPPRERRPESSVKPAAPKHRPMHRPPADKDHRPTKPATPSRPPAQFTPPVEVAFTPDDKAFASIVGTIKQSPRAYAFFDVAKLVLNKPERHVVKLQRPAGADGKHAPLFFVAAHDQVFLGREEALRWILRRHPGTVFEQTKTPIDPPKGNFVFVNRCGLTGEVLGPPNYHEYQSRLVRHHQARLAHMPFEKFRAQIQTSRDEAAVKAWIESLSSKMEFKCKLDTEPKMFASREELEKHVVADHGDALVAAVPVVTLTGPASRTLEHGAIQESVRLAWQHERRFPLKTANAMQTRLREQGLHFFKDTKGVTCVSTVKLTRFETGQVVSDHVRQIVEFVRGHQYCARQDLATALAATSGEELLAKDLHWLIQDGYVVEFFDGKLWIPEARTAKPAPAPVAVPAAEPPTSPS